ncbi:hypothetical protein M1D72_15390 [Vibrio sp. AK197]
MTGQDIELQHIYLEVKAERWQCIERFLLPYFCFRHQYITQQGKADWQKMRDKVASSDQVDDRKQAKLIPAIPHQTLIGKIKTLAHHQGFSLTSLEQLLANNLSFVLISNAEYQTLKSLKLIDKMPVEWYRSRHQAPMARFTHADIQFSTYHTDLIKVS